LVELRGDIYRPHRVDQRPVAVRDWERMYWRARKSGMTFRQAMGLYAKEHQGHYPASNLPLMPLDERDWHRKVQDVPFGRLVRRAQPAQVHQGSGVLDLPWNQRE
jgi:hypothetical protein